MTSVAVLAAPPDGGAVDRAVERVLLRPEFAGARKSWLARLRDNVQSWVVEQLARLFEGGTGSLIAWTIVAVVAVVAAILLFRLVRSVRRTAVVPAGTQVAIHIERSPAAWLAEAEAALRGGRIAEAVRCAYRAVVARLALLGAVEEVPGRTVGEYRQQVTARRPEFADAFTTASDVFERVWYARRPADAGDVDTVVTTARALGERT